MTEDRWTVVAHTSRCDDGDCPTIWQHTDGRARVRGTDPTTGQETDVVIDAESWAHMRAQLRGR